MGDAADSFVLPRPARRWSLTFAAGLVFRSRSRGAGPATLLSLQDHL